MSSADILALVALAIAVALAVLLLGAPVGYEDEDGFHLGRPPPNRRFSVTDPEPVERWIRFPSLVYAAGLIGIALIAWFVLRP